MKILQKIIYHLKVCETNSNFLNLSFVIVSILIASNKVSSNNDVNIKMEVPNTLKVKFLN